MIRVPEHRFTVIVLSNLGTMNPTALAHKVIALYLEEHLEPEEEKKPKDTVSVDPAIYDDCVGKRIEIRPLGAEQLKEYEGDYTSEELMVTYHLTQKDGNLVVRVKRNPEMKLELADKDAFVGARYKGVFERDSNGAVTGFVLDAGRVKNLRFVKKSKS